MQLVIYRYQRFWGAIGNFVNIIKITSLVELGKIVFLCIYQYLRDTM